ncbi:MAG: N-acyl-D-amino-acid deacylase [Gammaproteobacteria bacterium]|jgi:N-acyl-D-amino-acid deacylase
MNNHVDLLIRGATVYDGTGAAAVVEDVAVAGERIVRIGSLDWCTAAREIDASKLALAPGFIDVHTHDDFAALAHPDMGFKSRGGVTTCIVGNCGFGAAPFDAAQQMLGKLTPGMAPPNYLGHAGYASLLEAHPTGVNIGVLAGHGTLRLAAMGRADRDASDREMAQMKAALCEALDAGVFGFSSGLSYEPGRYAKTDELVELACEMSATNGLYATHLRDQGADLLASVDEAIAIGERAAVGVQISHHKASGRENWGLVNESLLRIEAAQSRGVRVHADQYPYTAGSTMLEAVLLNGVFGDGPMASLRADEVVIASAPGQPDWEGQSMQSLSALLGLAPRQAAERIVELAPGATAILHMISEEDVRVVMRHPSTMIGSDGIPAPGGRPHPRLYNSFARVLGHYARDERVFDLSTAVYRMTGFSADKFALRDRGQIKEGSFADLVLFDASTIVDRGTFEEPNQFPDGIHEVFVNGRSAVREDAVSDERAGKVLRRGD